MKSIWTHSCFKETNWNRCTVRHHQYRTETMSEQALALVSKINETEGMPKRYEEIIKKYFNTIQYEEFLKNKKQLANMIQVVFIWECSPTIDENLLESLPQLKIVVNHGAGVDHLNLPLIYSFGVKVANTPDVVDNATAEMGMALMLASARNILEAQEIATCPDTKSYPMNWYGVEVTEATLGIIGMGRIGYKVAQRAKGFDMKILYHNRNRRTEEEERLVGACYCAKIDDLLQESDFVMLVVNLTPQTYKLIGERELNLMKPNATLINISRGGVVDQDALVKVLQNGAIRGAALDVTDPEPLPRDHPLLHLPNIILTPHLGTATDKTNTKMMEKMIENALAAVNGLPLPDEVLPP
ncbi:probable 2-ketogluconate reductase isoform X1 [Scyliorhinus canicula]|uniref:probable 2-ketogluconate reductase isoform X1 n=2 Tax=Scyliorhinus canicula TaxID=7830 RepID=UPI0018F5464D|nr:probable 2-ketogluconate reductase isoform X1 [Scyliorhinus canicula]